MSRRIPAAIMILLFLAFWPKKILAAAPFQESAASFVTSPLLVTLLLSVACICLITEVFTPGFGIAGVIGVITGGLFLYGHIAAGLVTGTDLLILAAGLLFLIIELFAPGGIMGIIGTAGVVWVLFRIGENKADMMLSISIAFLLSCITAVIVIRIVGFEKGMFRRMILMENLYQAEPSDYTHLIGEEGTALTPLRPTGAARIGTDRYEVITEGRYVKAGVAVKVVHTAGLKIVVRETQNKEEQV